jgi:hypothetical protein
MPVEPPYVLLGQMRTRLFFLCIALLCIAAWADSYLANYSAKNARQSSTAFYRDNLKKVSIFYFFLCNIIN